LAISPSLAGRQNEIEFIGMDALSSGKSRMKNVRLITGNLVTKPFPKSDLVFSMVVLGYAGNIGFVVKKAGNSLKPGGAALLQINKKGRAQFSDHGKGILEGQMVTLVQDMPKLARNLQKMKIPGCEIFVFTPPGWGGNLAVLIRKK
jgi:SAM-dependent methyltransferase